MSNLKKICICGGGGLGHTCAAVLSSHDGIEVSLYTQRPNSWNTDFIVNAPDKQFKGRLFAISNNPEEVISNADIILLCLPAFLVESTLVEIKPYLSSNAIVGSVVGNTGFFLFAHKIFTEAPIGLFAFQRVPYISRVVDYGKEALLLGYKDELLMATENIIDPQSFSVQISRLFRTSTSLVDSFYEVTLSNSNPILHTGRLFSMWKDCEGKVYDVNPLFYHDWTDEASSIIIQMDNEFSDLLEALNIPRTHLKTLLEHYGVVDPHMLTLKLKSIPSFATILSPMKEVDSGWKPDFTSRYFTEDFPYGLRFIHDLAHEYNIECPTIDMVYTWGINVINNNL